MKNYNNLTRQAGLTLLELAVVLLILVGLSGMLIPYVSSFIGKTHTATSGYSIAALNQAIFRFGNESFGAGANPDNYDALVDINQVGAGIPGAAQYAVEAVSANALTALNAAGIANVLEQEDTTVATSDMTFGAGTPQTLVVGAGAGGSLRVFTGAGITNLQSALGILATDTRAYVAFGVGQGSDLVTRTIAEAPVHFHEGAADYETRYSRFIAVYGIDSTDNTLANATATANAKFLGVVGPMNPVEGIGGHIKDYRQIVEAENS